MTGCIDTQQPNPRVAQTGDICMLLEPADDDIPAIRELQMSLQSRWGGQPQERVHLTCQRFRLSEKGLLPDVVSHLETRLTVCPPFPVVATSLVQVEHGFFRARVLRWRIQATDELRRFTQVVEEGLMEVGVSPHFPYSATWSPVVTALEAMPEEDPGRLPGQVAFPQHLFTGRQVVLSKILGQRQFDILATVLLGEE